MIWTSWETRSVGSFRLGFAGKAVWLVLAGSHTSELRIDRCLFF